MSVVGHKNYYEGHWENLYMKSFEIPQRSVKKICETKANKDDAENSREIFE